MNLNFMFLVFCLTVITLVSISHNKDKLAEKSIAALSSLTQQAIESMIQIKHNLKKYKDDKN